MFDRKVQLFLTVVEEGSFSAAGRRLLLSQSAVSQQVAVLEKELGVRLFERSGYRPKLTEAGQFYYDGVSRIAQQYDSLEKKIKKTVGQQAILRIGVTGPYEGIFIPELMNQFKQEYREVEVKFKLDNFHNGINSLRNREIDVFLGIESDFSKVYPMSRTFSFLFFKNLGTEF